MYSAIRRLCPVLNTEFERGDNSGHVTRVVLRGLNSPLERGKERVPPSPRVERCASIYNTDVISHLAVTYRPTYSDTLAQSRGYAMETLPLSPEIDVYIFQPREEFAWELQLSFVRGKTGKSFVLIYAALDFPRCPRLIGVATIRGEIPCFLNDARLFGQ